MIPKYWRDPEDDTVHLSHPSCSDDEFDVVVIPVGKWRELVQGIYDTRDGIARDSRIDTIIAEVGSHD